MAATGTITVNHAAWAAITALSYCHNIRITENRGASGYPNGDFLVAKPVGMDPGGIGGQPSSGVRIQAGASYTFNAPQGKFNPGQIVGYVQMVNSVTTSFDLDEDAA